MYMVDKFPDCVKVKICEKAVDQMSVGRHPIVRRS